MRQNRIRPPRVREVWRTRRLVPGQGGLWGEFQPCGFLPVRFYRAHTLKRTLKRDAIRGRIVT